MGPERRRNACIAAFTAAALTAGHPAAAQDPSPSPSPAADDVRARLDRLEAQNADLAARVAELAAERDAAAEGGTDDGATGLSARFGEVELSLRTFGDYGFAWQNARLDDQSTAAFQFGSLDLFLTGRIGDRFRVLSESLIEGDQDEVRIDEERLYGAWDFNDALYAKLGLEHLPTCRWNRIFHHGKWLQLTIERPFLARFEDDGGFLPMHYSGLELGGTQRCGAGALEYMAIVSNGRGPVPTDRQRGSDANSGKALDAALSFAPAAVDGLTFGGNARHESFPANPTDPARTKSEGEWAEGLFVQLERGPLTALAEATFVQHDDRTSDRTFRHRSQYVQAGWRMGDWTPYARADFRSMQDGDPYFAPDGLDHGAWEATAGVRLDFAASAALKVELRRGLFEQSAAGGGTRRVGVTTLALQLAWSL